MKLEVGKTYVNRVGCVVRITSCDNSNDYPFNDPYGASYTEEGLIWIGRESNGDLVLEYKPSVQLKIPLTLDQIHDMHSEANKWYCIDFEDYVRVVRDTERKHGIGE